MDHERAFLQAIREEPDDDTPRLVYADWLEEQGGAARSARAAFIRSQCRLAALPDDDPQRDALEDEAADLLTEHEYEWTQSLFGIAESWRFVRGFVEHVSIRTEGFLSDAESLFAFTPLRSLHLLIPPKDVPHLAACPQLQWVETLDFFGCQLNDRSLQQLLTSPYLGRLSELDLSGNIINTPGVQALVQSPLMGRLRRLNLGSNLGVADRALQLLAQSAEAKALHVLGLARTSITERGIQGLFHSSQLVSLTDLNVSACRGTSLAGPSVGLLADSPLLAQLQRLDLSESIHREGLRALLASPRVARLQRLAVRGIQATGADIETMVKSPHLASLASLDLRQNQLGGDGAKLLSDAPCLASLTWLDLNSNNLRDTGARAIAESPHLKRLRMLELSRNGIGGPGLQALADSESLCHLRILRLAGNFIGADSVRALAESSQLCRLTFLDLRDGCLESESAAALAASANLARLSFLLLSKNLLGDAGAKALARSPHLTRLRTLDLNDNRIGKAGGEALAAAPGWRRLRNLDLRGNVFTDTQESLLRGRFGSAVQL